MRFPFLFFVIVHLSFSVVAQLEIDSSLIRKGSKWQVTRYNKRDKAKGLTSYEVLEINKKEGDITNILLEVTRHYKNGDTAYHSTDSIKRASGTLRLNIQTFFNHGFRTGSVYRSTYTTVYDPGIEFLEKANIGDSLRSTKTFSFNALIYVQSPSGSGLTGGWTEWTRRCFDRKITGLDTLSTKAGKFETYVISQKIKYEKTGK